MYNIFFLSKFGQINNFFSWLPVTSKVNSDLWLVSSAPMAELSALFYLFVSSLLYCFLYISLFVSFISSMLLFCLFVLLFVRDFVISYVSIHNSWKFLFTIKIVNEKEEKPIKRKNAIKRISVVKQEWCWLYNFVTALSGEKKNVFWSASIIIKTRPTHSVLRFQ